MCEEGGNDAEAKKNVENNPTPEWKLPESQKNGSQGDLQNLEASENTEKYGTFLKATHGNTSEARQAAIFQKF